MSARRAAYLAELAQGTDRFHEPRSGECPWCGSPRLRTRLTAPDLLQHKPGRFTLDECRDCAHAFQNPGLTPAGLAFYTRDPYPQDRPGRRRLLATARAMLPFPEPESWLDIGTGDAAFPAVAKEVFPYTSFDGVDPTARVERARAAGRVEEAYAGDPANPHLAARLRSRYDVVSVLHHLTHTADPRAQLRAALTALRPGGHLLLQLPDPHSAFARLLGRWWHAHTQPRHLHLMPLENIRAELTAQSCVIVSAGRTEAHTPTDLTRATALALSRLAPPPDAPWRPAAPTDLQRGLRTALLRTTRPLVLTATATDHTLAPLLRRTPFANTYRVIARKEPA
ncbi:class I SAM-dependent methyltransferase [Streptomyces sp. NPDC048002]|uniref:class I SAM-dependent methyltransferase n=1 Tax=unclassified Streptomyces TaxID=2593676 RepID=UPI0033E595D9